MYESKFTKWSAWVNRDDLQGISYPGVYAIRISSKNISGRNFSWHREIVYVGMTNGVSGLKGRLKAFDNTINGKKGHGGADRFRYKHQNYKTLVKKLFVSVAPFKGDVTSNLPKDLLLMGDVAKFEYQCFAQYVEKYGGLPEFNDKKEAMKFSLTYGKKNH